MELLHSSVTVLDKLVQICVMLVILDLSAVLSYQEGQYCQNDEFTATCTRGHVIVMHSAMYGRMSLNKCIQRDYGNIGCGTDVLPIAHNFCSGRESCVIRVPNDPMDARVDCPHDFKNYLETSYACLPVVHADRGACTGTSAITLTATSGILANVVTSRTGCGGVTSPWRIKGKPGQRVNITMYDYTNPHLLGYTGVDSENCAVYAILKDREAQKAHSLCGGQHRTGHAYLSTSHELEVQMLGGLLPSNGETSDLQRYFLLEYRIVGCANPLTPLYGWTSRDGDDVTMGCTGNDVTWSLTCRDGSWHGNIHNCTKVLTDASTWNKLPITYELSIGIVCIIAACIAVCILVIGLVMMRRRRYQGPVTKTVLRHPAPPYHEGGYPAPHHRPGTLPPPHGDYRNKMVPPPPTTTATTGHHPHHQQAYWSRQDPYRTPSENEYASIQDNTSPTDNNETPGIKHIIPPYSDCELPGSHQPASAGVMCRGQPYVPPGGMSSGIVVEHSGGGSQPVGGGREYYLIDPDTEVSHLPLQQPPPPL